MYKISNKTATSATIHLYDDIGGGWFGGVSATQVVEDIKALGSISQLDVRINSAGGSVFEGVTIYNVLSNNEARVVTYVDGLAASIASIVAMAGDEIHMAENAMMMIHDPWSMSIGSAEDLRKEADLLDTIKGVLVDTYAKRTGLEASRVEQLMTDETWLTAQDAIEYGFADSSFEEMKAAARLDISRYLDRYQHIPDALKTTAGNTRHHPVIDQLKAQTRTISKTVREQWRANAKH